jgi:metal-sulfur cluster biosynthetic enzyme
MQDDFYSLRRSREEAERARAERPSARAGEASRFVPAPGSPEAALLDQLRAIYDPELPVDIVELGLIYGLSVQDRRVEVRMTLTAPGCGVGEILKREVERKLRAVVGINEVTVEIVFDPPWSPSQMSPAARLKLGLM